MKVEWTEWNTVDYDGIHTFRTDYEGDVIGTGSGFWHGHTLIIACTDGKVRSIGIDKVKIKK